MDVKTNIKVYNKEVGEYVEWNPKSTTTEELAQIVLQLAEEIRQLNRKLNGLGKWKENNPA